MPDSKSEKPIMAQFKTARVLLQRSIVPQSSPQSGKENANTKHGATGTTDSEKAAKSCAQVARMVAPYAGGLKPGDESEPLLGDKIDDEASDETNEYETQDEDSGARQGVQSAPSLSPATGQTAARSDMGWYPLKTGHEGNPARATSRTVEYSNRTRPAASCGLL